MDYMYHPLLREEMEVVMIEKEKRKVIITIGKVLSLIVLMQVAIHIIINLVPGSSEGKCVCVYL